MGGKEFLASVLSWSMSIVNFEMGIVFIFCVVKQMSTFSDTYCLSFLWQQKHYLLCLLEDVYRIVALM